LFDTPESLTTAVTAFLFEGYQANNTILLAITPRHWTLIAEAITKAGCPVADLITRGQLTVLDAAATLNAFMRGGRPDAQLFDEVVGEAVRQVNRRGHPLRIYGEMVNLLAGEGDFKGAKDLEELWNELGEREPFTLFCGYSTVHFGDPRTGPALREICRTHNHVYTDPRDILSTFLLDASGHTVARASLA
jgi:hypothetical protein